MHVDTMLMLYKMTLTLSHAVLETITTLTSLIELLYENSVPSLGRMPFVNISAKSLKLVFDFVLVVYLVLCRLSN
jgi:hypothetical protein